MRSGLYGACPNDPWEVKSNHAIYFVTNTKRDSTPGTSPNAEWFKASVTYVQNRLAPHFSCKTLPSIMTFKDFDGLNLPIASDPLRATFFILFLEIKRGG